MALIEWNESFSVNVQAMDAQHKRLIEMINRLHEAMRAGKSSLEVGAIADQMIAYSQGHFRDEENLMAAHGYTGLLRQQQEHQAFIRKAGEFKQNAIKGQLSLGIPMSDYLKTWLTTHIQVEDKKYGKYLSARGIA